MDQSVLRNYFFVSQKLREALESEMCLESGDQLRLENHLSMLQMAYIEWKVRQGLHGAYLESHSHHRTDGPLSSGSN